MSDYVDKATAWDMLQVKQKGIDRLRAQVAALEADKAALTTALRNCVDYMRHFDSEEPIECVARARTVLAAHGTKP